MRDDPDGDQMLALLVGTGIIQSLHCITVWMSILKRYITIIMFSWIDKMLKLWIKFENKRYLMFISTAIYDWSYLFPALCIARVWVRRFVNTQAKSSHLKRGGGCIHWQTSELIHLSEWTGRFEYIVKKSVC